MASLSDGITLVDLDGRPISADDQGDASTWPASNLVDGWHWEVEPAERAALEQAEVERIQDVVDAPPLSQVSPTELAVMAAGMAI